MSQPNEPAKTFMQKVLDVVERVGNKVPHPAVIFAILIILVLVLSHVLHLMGTSVTAQVIEPAPADVAATEDGDAGDDEAGNEEAGNEEAGDAKTKGVVPNWDYEYPTQQDLFDAHDVEGRDDLRQ